MSYPADDLRSYLINNGIPSNEVQTMTEDQVMQMVSVFLDSSETQVHSQTNDQKSVNKNPVIESPQKSINKQPVIECPQKSINKKSPVFDRKRENGGLNDDEALRVAIRESINCQSNSHNTPNKDTSNDNSKLSQKIANFAKNTFQYIRDNIRNDESFFAIQQNTYNYIDFSSDDDDFLDIYYQKQRNHNNEQYSTFIPSQYNDTEYNKNNQATQHSNFMPPPRNNQNSNCKQSNQQNVFQNQNQNNPTIEDLSSDYDDDITSDQFNNTHYIIRKQNAEFKELEQEATLKEQEEEQKKLKELDEQNIKEACQVSLAEDIINLLDELPQEPAEPKNKSDNRKVATIAVTMNSGRKIYRRFNDTDKGIFVYAWVAGHTLDSDEKLYLDAFELKEPFGQAKVIDKNLTLGEQGIRGRVCYNAYDL